MVLPNLLINYHITREKAIVESENNDKKITSYVVQLHNFSEIEQNWYNSALKNAARWNLRHKGDDCAEREGGYAARSYQTGEKGGAFAFDRRKRVLSGVCVKQALRSR